MDEISLYLYPQLNIYLKTINNFMRKNIIIIALALFGMGVNANAQFFKKLGQALENAGKAVDKITSDAPGQTEAAGQAANVATVATAEATMPANVVVVAKKSVNVREAPEANANVLMKAPYCTLFELVSEQDGWYEVSEAWTGRKAYISKTVAEVYESGYVEVTGLSGFIMTESGEYAFEQVEKSNICTSTTSYDFYYDNANDKQTVRCLKSIRMIYNDGRMRTYETYYKGVQRGWYVALTEEVDYDGETQEKLEQPVIVYREPNNDGIYIEGVRYQGMSY